MRLDLLKNVEISGILWYNIPDMIFCAKGVKTVSYSRRLRGGSILDVKSSIKGVCSCTRFETEYFTLPTQVGAQISMTGSASACRSRCTTDTERLSGVLCALGSRKSMREADAKIFAARRRFTLLCGENSTGIDRTVAIIASLGEIVNAGALKIIICTDDVHERYSLTESLEVMRNVFGVTSYIPGEYDDSAKYTLSASVYSFLASTKPEVLVVGRDCITKHTNLVRRKNGEDESLIELLAKLHPIVITTSKKISTGRSMAKICGIFEPSLTFVFCNEVKNLKDAVIFVPGGDEVSVKEEKVKVPEQLSF